MNSKTSYKCFKFALDIANGYIKSLERGALPAYLRSQLENVRGGIAKLDGRCTTYTLLESIYTTAKREIVFELNKRPELRERLRKLRKEAEDKQLQAELDKQRFEESQTVAFYGQVFPK